MTNQEAIALLKIERDHMTPTIFTERVEAMDMAISALQAQEAKAQLSAEGTTSDLISRQDAIEVIEEMQMPIMRSMFPEEQFVFKGMSEALSAIKDLPSAQPETAKRIVGKSRDGMTLWYQCDMCNEPVDAQDNFCRGCGRRLTDG